MNDVAPLDIARLTAVDVLYHNHERDEPAPVGQVLRDVTRRGDRLSFVYDDGWFGADGCFQLDATLPLYAGHHFMGSEGGIDALSPAFEDCSPDRWGKILMKRREAIRAKAEDRRIRGLRSWDYLLGSPDSGRMGALRMRDPVSGRWLDDSALAAPPVTSLAELEAVARAVDSGRDLAAEEQVWLRQLIAPGTSLGGARPKSGFASADGQLWLAKFPGANDEYDVGRWEFITWQLARQAGISRPDAKLLPLSADGHTFAVRRFDRDNQGRRIHYASAMTMLNAIDSEGVGYRDIADEIGLSGAAGAIADDLEQLFRRVIFNILVGNRDDHLRNHGFLRMDGGWRLSPAFDVNPNPHKDVHVLGVAGDDPTPDTGGALADHRHYRLTKARAGEIADQVRKVVAGWRTVAKAARAPDAEIDLMEPVFDSAR